MSIANVYKVIWERGKAQLTPRPGTMKTVVVLAGLVAIAFAAQLPPKHEVHDFKQGKCFIFIC